jgi:hypothetical protein
MSRLALKDDCDRTKNAHRINLASGEHAFRPTIGLISVQIPAEQPQRTFFESFPNGGRHLELLYSTDLFVT